MKHDIRTFIAIKIEPEQALIDQLLRFKILFKEERINWVSPENFHLTLRFLGITSHVQLISLETKLEQISQYHDSFEIIITGTGIFGKKGNPRVIFAGINFPEELKNLADEIEKEVVSLGFHDELKPFRPHLTLGRIKHLNNRSRFKQMMSDLPQIDDQVFRVSEFILYQSILRPEGPVYKPIKSFLLKG